MYKPLLEVKNLRTYFYNNNKEVKAVENISFILNKKEILGIVGESGSGKSVSSLSIMKLIPKTSGKIKTGEIIFNNKNLLQLTDAQMSKIRGKNISMIFQEPMSSLNPVFSIGYQISEVIKLHEGKSGKENRKIVEELLRKVHIENPEVLYNNYPHELSGGMMQRVMIAMALACNPQIIIADEPTTALDVTIQSEILILLKELKDKNNTSIIFITHDLGVIAEMADRVLVMYKGEIVEEADVFTIFDDPIHPYTKGLLKARPGLNTKEERLYSMPEKIYHPYFKKIEDGYKLLENYKEEKNNELLENYITENESEYIEYGDNRKVRGIIIK